MDPSQQPIQMSAGATALQNQFMNNPSLLQQYYQAYHAKQLEPQSLAAFQELLQAAEHQEKMKPQQQAQQQRQGAMQNPMPQFQQPVPSPQPAYGGTPNMLTAQHLQMAKEQLADFKTNQQKQTALKAFLGRTDVGHDQRQKAESELVKTEGLIAAFQQRIKNDPNLMKVLQAQAAQNANTQRLMQAQQQQRQQTASPALGAQSMPGPSNPNIARARSPSNVPGRTATPPPMQQSRMSTQSSQGSKGQPPQASQPPTRPQSAAPSSSSAFNPVVQGPAAIADDISNRVTASRPEQFPNARPTLTQGLAAQPAVSTPAITRPPNTVPASLGSQSSIEQSKADLNRIMPRRSLRDIVTGVDPGTSMDEEVEDLLLEIADEFIESVTKHSCALAVHRKSDRLEVKDIQLHLDRVWGISIPGFASDDIRQSQARRLNPPASQIARATAVREAARSRR